MESVLNTEAAGRKIWVVKVPPFVAKKWRDICDQADQQEAEVGPKLGTISYSSAAGESKGPTFKLHLDNESTKDLPQDYDMQAVTQNAPQMLAFSQAGRRTAAEGIAQHRFDIEPAAKDPTNVDPAYKNLSKTNLQGANKKARTIQMMSGPQFTNLRKPVGLTDIGGSKRKDASEKRIAKPAAELQADLFRMFERQAHWAFVQLQKETEQPTQHLKSVLSEIAMQNKRGPYKDLWELKREFKTGGTENAAS